MRWVRWWGISAFIAVCAVIIVFWYLLAGLLVKYGIEKAGTRIVGAKVELKKADLSLFPLGLTLTGLQVTNPEKPMTNAFEAGRISFGIDGIHLLRKKYIIEEMAVEGVRLNTPRKRSGALLWKKIAGKGEREAQGPITFQVPDLKEVLSKEQITSVRTITALSENIEKDRELFKKQFEALPGKKKFDEYEARVDKLKKSGKTIGGALGGASEVLALQKDIQADMDRIASFRAGLEKQIVFYQNKAGEAAKEPFEDIKRIKEKYLSAGGIANLSRYFIGGWVIDSVDNALNWRARVDKIVNAVKPQDGVEVKKPLRGKGVYVLYPEQAPLPGLLIKRTAVSLSIPSGDIKGTVTDITDDQRVLGRPLRFALSGGRLKGLDAASFAGEISRVIPLRPKDVLDISVSGYRVKDFTLTENEWFNAVIKEGLSDFKAHGEIDAGAFKAGIETSVRSALLSATAQDVKNPAMAAAVSALSGVKGFNLRADVTGTVQRYAVDISSDIDRVFKDALGKTFTEKAEQFEAGLKKEVLQKTEKPLQDLNRNLGEFVNMDGELKKLTGMYEGLLKDLAGAGLRGIPKLPF